MPPFEGRRHPRTAERRNLTYWRGQIARLVIGGAFLYGVFTLGEERKALTLAVVAAGLYGVLIAKWLLQKRRNRNIS